MHKFWTPIGVTILSIIGFGMVSALSTKSAYQFQANYEGLGSELVYLNLNQGRVKMQYVGYDKNESIVKTKQFFGVFMKWGSHYFMYQLEQSQPYEPQTVNIKNAYIEDINDNQSVYISDQRGVFVTKDGKALELKAILHGERLS
ncbi:hypothetical protein KI655_17000 [Vibrio sp. D404a]|uniref:hypothetical protein n=1 Tax=unclassified Vibrio TaxID=2614977 RepID=UPI0025562240|nr:MULTISPECIES: hypothetical protein [unclassified Vibrio]MDK9739003.1 hypothetical protein [Vibrio sp. D404a]MDK9799539.1 hypothetical protein [Vibrio sp. D449a]